MTLVRGIDRALLERFAQEKSVIGSATYYGFVKDHGLRSVNILLPVFAICRITVNGTNESFEWAGGAPSFDYLWSLKTTYFPALAFQNWASVLLDGVNDYIDFGTTIGQFERTDPWTAAFWYRPSVMSSTSGLMGKSLSGTTQLGWTIYREVTSNRLAVQLSNTAATNAIKVRAPALNALTLNVWHFICITNSGSSTAAGVKIYIVSITYPVNPSSPPVAAALTKTVDQDNLSATMVNTAQSMVIGAWQVGLPAGGNFDMVSLWNVEFSLAEVNELLNIGTPLHPLSHSRVANLIEGWTLGEGVIGVGESYPTLYGARSIYNGTLTNSSAANIVPVFPGSIL